MLLFSYYVSDVILWLVRLGNAVYSCSTVTPQKAHLFLPKPRHSPWTHQAYGSDPKVRQGFACCAFYCRCCYDILFWHHVTRRLWLLLTHINNTGKPGQFLCGISPPEDNDPDFDSTDTLANPDHELFEEEIWPRLYERVPAFGDIKVTGRSRSYIAFLLSLQQHGLFITSLSSVLTVTNTLL
jgi:glycine/D-amino acid oxidase-like deaminating enzyme